METGDIEEVKSAFKLVYKHWDVMDYWDNPLVMQKACNQFTKRLSNEQDAEFLGTVLTLVAKILPFNHQAGINKMWTVNQHPIHMDDTVEVYQPNLITRPAAQRPCGQLHSRTAYQRTLQTRQT